MILIENKRCPLKMNGAVRFYVGRPSALGNPFHMGEDTPEERKRVCELYAAWLCNHAGDYKVARALNRIRDAQRQGVVILTCHCAPKQCHAEEIKRFLEAMK